MTSPDDLVALKLLLEALKQYGVTEYEDGNLKLKLSVSFDVSKVDPAVARFLEGSKLGVQTGDETAEPNQFKQLQLKGFRKNDD